MNTQKPVAFLSTDGKHTEKGIRETTPFIIAIHKNKPIKQLSIGLTEGTKDLRTEEKTEENTGRQKDLLCVQIRRARLVKMASHQNLPADPNKASDQYINTDPHDHHQNSRAILHR